MKSLQSKLVRVGVAAVVVLAAVWFISPVIQKKMHLCVIKPGLANQAEAVPAYARKYGLSCSQCHTAFPALNDYGRQFKMNGYVRERGSLEGAQQPGDGGDQVLENVFPWGAVVKLRPYDRKRTDNEFKFRALHEIELFIAGGNAAKDISYYMEIEAEDENVPVTTTDTGGDTGTGNLPDFPGLFKELQFGYHPSSYANFLIGYRSFFNMDPFQTLSDHGKLTRSGRSFASQTHVSGDSLNSTKQTAVLYGEVEQEGLAALYYSGGYSADTNDNEGEGPKDWVGRLAVDSLRGVVFGGFWSTGHEGWIKDGEQRQFRFQRYGLDTLLEKWGVTARGAWVRFKDEDRAVAGSAEVTNDGSYLETFYTVKKDDRPFMVPLLRYDNYEKNNGVDNYGSITAHLSAYLRENVRAFVEYWAEVTRPDSADHNHRWTVQAEVGF